MKLQTVLWATASMLFAACLAVAQNNLYVSTSGRNNKSCASAEPCATIAYASSLAKPGDTILVAPGTYEGSFQTRASGTESAYITYLSQERWGAKLVQGRSGSAWGNYGNFVVIDGFEIVGNPESVGVNGIYTQGDYVLLRHNKIHGVLPNTCNGRGGSGIQLDSSHDQVIGNYIYQIGPQPGSPLYPCSYVHGIYFLKPFGLAAENIVFQTSGYAIHEWHQASDITVMNNTVFNNGFGGILVGNDGSSEPRQNNRSVIADNIVYGNGKFGIHECCRKPNTGTCNLYSNNLLYKNPTNIELQTGSQDQTKNADPLCVNYTGDASGDYHVQPGSPAIRQGRIPETTPCGATNTKFLLSGFSGKARIRPGQTAFDIGAYQSN